MLPGGTGTAQRLVPVAVEARLAVQLQAGADRSAARCNRRMKITVDQCKKLLALNDRVGFEDSRVGQAVTLWLAETAKDYVRLPAVFPPHRHRIVPPGRIVPANWTPAEARVFYTMLKSALGERLTPAYKRGFKRLSEFVFRTFDLSAIDLLAELAEPGPHPHPTVRAQVGPCMVNLGVHAAPLLGSLLVTLRDVCEKLDIDPHPAAQVAFNAILKAQLDRRSSRS